MMRAQRSALLFQQSIALVVVLFVAIASLLSIPGSRAQFSRPVATAADSLAHAARSRFASRESTGDLGSHPLTGEDDDDDHSIDDDRPSFHHSFANDADAGACGAPLSHLWTADAGASSIAATPLITDLFSDGSKEIIVPAFVHELEALDGASGARWADGRWPAFHGSSAHASPVLADVDGDGVQDLLLATYDGQVSAYRDTGERIRLVDENGKGGLAFPRLKVRTLWYEGLAVDPTSHDHPDLGKNEDAQRELEKKLVEESLAAREKSSGGVGVGGGRRLRRRSLMQVAKDAASASSASSSATSSVEAAAKATFDELFGEQGKGGENSNNAAAAAAAAAAGGSTSTTTFADANDGKASQQLQREQLTPELMAALLAEGIDAAEIEGIQERLANEAEAEIEAAENARTGGTESLRVGGGDNAELWGDERPDVERLPSNQALRDAGVVDTNVKGTLPELILVDAHVLATPVVADVDGDGHDELVAAVSYFFDDAEWPHSRIDRELGIGVDTDKYVMAGCVAISLRGGGSDGRGGTRKRGDVVWASHLDSSTSSSHFQARALASPSIADVDRDGKLEVVVTTTLGFVYILEGATGKARDGWPLQLAPLQASAALADVDGCGKLELIVADEAGTVAALRSSPASNGGSNGTSSFVLWERHLGAAITATPALGDVDGDGDLEVVVGDAAGTVWCLDARTGLDANRWQHGKGDVASKKNALWPWKRESGDSLTSSSSSLASRRGARGRIVAAPLLVPLGDPPLHEGRHPPLRVVVPAFDGILYAISGDGACADALDLGEASYSRPLADDIDGDGSLEIVLATMSGSVHAIKAGRAGVSHRADPSAAAAAALHLPPLAAAALAAVSSSHSSSAGPGLPSLQLDADDPPPADPLAVTAEALPDGNRFVCSAPSFEGVRALTPDRSPRDVRGRELSVRFEVVDRRSRKAGPEIPVVGAPPALKGIAEDDNGGRGPYKVTVSLQGVGPEQMIGGGKKSSKGSTPSSFSASSATVVGMTGTYPRPGIYSLTLPVPRARTTATVRLEMVDEVRFFLF